MSDQGVHNVRQISTKIVIITTTNLIFISDLCGVDALDLDVCLEVMMVAGGEDFNVESTGSVLHNGRLRVETGTHYLFAQDEHVGNGVNSHQTLLVVPLKYNRQ
jgi:hypothetical protein